MRSPPEWSSVRVQWSFDSRTELFSTKTQHKFCSKTQSDEKTFTIFNGNPTFYQTVICTRNMHFWQRRRKSCVIKKRKSLIWTLEIDQKTEKKSKKITKSCSCDEKLNFLNSAQKGSSIVKLFFNLSRKMIKTKILFTKIVFCSKMTLCTSRMQLWRLLTYFPSKIWHIFLFKSQKWLKKLFYKNDFATKVQHFL